LLIQNGKVIAAGTSVNIPKHNYSQFRREIYLSLIYWYVLVLEWTNQENRRFTTKSIVWHKTRRLLLEWTHPFRSKCLWQFQLRSTQSWRITESGFVCRHACARRHRERYRFTDCFEQQR
jgi:hypothetical protein